MTTEATAVDYRPTRTLPVRVELVRQLRRRRTQIALGFLVILPFLLLIAFKIGNGSSNRGLVDHEREAVVRSLRPALRHRRELERPAAVRLRLP